MIFGELRTAYIILAAVLVLSHVHCRAREPMPPPSPVTTTESTGKLQNGVNGNSVYIGHYGEVVEIPYGWSAEPRMRELTEVVYIHPDPQFNVQRKSSLYKKSDYTPANFATMGLMELVVIPKDAPGGLRDLREIRRRKENELRETGADFELIDENKEPYFWPSGSFHVRVARPYPLWQIYSESANEFYILTLGPHLKEGDLWLSNTDVSDFNYANTLVKRSLGTFLLNGRRNNFANYLFRPEPRSSINLKSPFRIYSLRFWGLSTILGLLLLLLAYWPKKSTVARKINFFARSMILFGLIMGLLEFLAVLIPTYFFDLTWRQSAAPELLPLLLAPLISWQAAKWLGGGRLKSAVSWVSAVAISLAVFSCLANTAYGTQPAVIVAFTNGAFFVFLGLIFGVVFAFAMKPLSSADRPK